LEVVINSAPALLTELSSASMMQDAVALLEEVLGIKKQTPWQLVLTAARRINIVIKIDDGLGWFLFFCVMFVWFIIFLAATAA
jgi:hypothetical protein